MSHEHQRRETPLGDDRDHSSPLLMTHGVTKRYGRVTVLSDVNLEVRVGEIHALIGANGAGKSTLCKIISGLTAATAGTMSFYGKPYAPADKRAAEMVGVQIIQQELNLIPTLTVAENICLGRFPNRWGVLRQRQIRERARIALDRFGLTDIKTDVRVEKLGVGRQQMVEIASALDRECRLLILDEPTAALSAGETERLFEWLSKLRESGVGMIYISHRLDEVARMCDRLTVLRDGKHQGTHPTASLSTEQMVDQMSGTSERASATRDRSTDLTARPVALRVRGLGRGEVVKDVSLQVRQGERLGIAGLVGSGRTELLRLIFGADQADTGELLVGSDETPRRFKSPAHAVAAGIALLTEDRKSNGLLLQQSIRVNTAMAAMHKRFSRLGLIRKWEEHRVAGQMRASLDVRCTDTEQPVGALSGGNQQKVAVSKWLVRDADVLLLDEPTRGIDVAARRAIYRLMDQLSDQNKAMVIVSSDLEELLETCDRIAVMSAGRLVQTFDRGQWSEDEIMQAAFSGYVQAAIA
ncbi:MAG: sugar ABC transporter ATP-binding protein [Planctomycetota bacterium]